MNKKSLLIILSSIALVPTLLISFYFYKNYIAFTDNSNTQKNNIIEKIPEKLGINNIEENLTNSGNENNNEIVIQEKIIEPIQTIIQKTPTMEFASIPLSININYTKLFYESLKIEFTDKIDNIIIIAKNDFDTGKDFSSIPIDTQGNTCYQTNCINLNSISDNLINDNQEFVKKKTEFFGLITHPIGTHFEYFEKYFPDKNISILFLNPNNLERINELKIHLQEKYKNEATLFLSISDFSEIQNEKYEKYHNIKTFYTLNNSKSPLEYKEIEVSCSTCLYLNNSLAFDNGKNPHKFFDKDNFVYYHEVKKEDNGIVIASFGDLMFDRNVSLYLTSEGKFDNFFKDFFQSSDTSLNPEEYKTRKLFGFDFVSANLETPIFTEESDCTPSTKSIQFCSKNIFLPWIKKLGFNIFSLANNHSMDGGISAHKSTIDNLNDVGIDYYGYVKHGPYLEENYVFTGSTRGIDFAWHSYDFTIYGDSLTEKYCNILKEYKNNGYQNFVATHWGTEYQHLEHSPNQENYAKKLIDCGADIIIGHHPHVTQDIGWYKNKPIIYSLGNFLFDQDWSDNTQVGIGTLIDYNINGKISITTEERNVAVKKSDS